MTPLAFTIERASVRHAPTPCERVCDSLHSDLSSVSNHVERHEGNFCPRARRVCGTESPPRTPLQRN